jgi:WD40 repeat protein
LPAREHRRRRLIGLLLALGLPALGLIAPSASLARVRPVEQSPPTIGGSAQLGAQLSASPGTWSGSPTSFRYKWLRCAPGAARCKKIRGAGAPTYAPVQRDLGCTLRVAVTAYGATGHSKPADSAPSEVVSGGPVSHLEYVLQDGTISVYDADNAFRPVKTISLPQTDDGIRGVAVAPSTGRMFIAHGGDGPINGSGNGSVLAYDLVSETAAWERSPGTGVDSAAVSPDGSTLYVPTGENTESGIWNVLSTAKGQLVGTIQGGAGAHNTIASSDGRYVYLGTRNHDYLGVYETASGAVRQIGPLASGVRPFTVNGSDTLAFTTATGLDGFQVSSIASGKVLFTVSFGEVPGGFPYTAPSHGIALSPDETQIYAIDSVHKEVQVWNVARAKEGIAPSQIGVIPLAGLTGEESPCAYDCDRSGWLQLSRDGRYLFVGDSGEVIETATRKVITTLPTLAQAKMSIEVDWSGGVPIATSTRSGVGYVQ